MRHCLLTLYCFLVVLNYCSAEKYWISFKDKSGVTFNPSEYFCARTIAQRIEQSIPLIDSTDFPVNENYLSVVSSSCDSISYSSRWLNGVAVYCNASSKEIISRLPFVLSVIKMEGRSVLTGKKDGVFELDKFSMDLLKYQTSRFGAQKFVEKKLDGSGVRIAVLDAGFPGVDNNEVFQKLRIEKRIISTYDFVSKKENVFAHHWHGAATLSCIVGIVNGVDIGMATGAEVLLARTEKVFSETISEEENWLAAAEWADKNGANIISSSLGYSGYRYFNTDMNGQASLISKAATIAARKGILVVNAAGNDGDNSWHFIDTPGDADSVLTVGGTDPNTDCHIGFSSFGPTANGKMKPNVCAPAYVIAANASGLNNVYGTSFSTPLVAGFAACAWQSNRSLTNMQLFHEIEKSSHLYPYFDFAHGYGIPQANYFTDSLKKEIEPTFDFVLVNQELKVVLREKFTHFDDEKLLGYEPRRNIFQKVEDKDGKLKRYSVLVAQKKEIIDLNLDELSPGDKLTIHFEGYTSSYIANENK